MLKRKYIKKSDYWDKFSKDSSEDLSKIIQSNDASPSSSGEPYYTESIASSYSRNKSLSDEFSSRRNATHKSTKKHRFSNIASGVLPYTYGADGVNVRETIELCQKAYANISVFRNAIDVMSEFANSEIHLEGGNQKARDFVYKWFDKTNMWNVKDQYFREYYRSGNIFLYRVDGKFTSDDFKKMSKTYGGIKPGQIPLKYIFLNPYDITAKRATSFSEGQYFKVLSEYDLERLSEPKTDYDQQVYESLPPDLSLIHI